MKKLVIIMFGLMIALSLTFMGCQKKEEAPAPAPEATPAPAPAPEATPAPAPAPEATPAPAPAPEKKEAMPAKPEAAPKKKPAAGY